MLMHESVAALKNTGIAIETLSEEHQQALSDLSPEEINALTRVTAHLSHRDAHSAPRGAVGGGLIF